MAGDGRSPASVQALMASLSFSELIVRTAVGGGGDPAPGSRSSGGDPATGSRSGGGDRPEGEKGSGENDDEFTFVVRDPDPVSQSVDAEDIFSGGQIRSVYPIFIGRPESLDGGDEEEKLASAMALPLRQMLEKERAEEDSSSSSDAPSSSTASEGGELDGVAPETYCAWAPRAPAPEKEPPGICRKGASGSECRRRRRRILDLLAGRNLSEGGKGRRISFVAPSPASGGSGWWRFLPYNKQSIAGALGAAANATGRTRSPSF